MDGDENSVLDVARHPIQNVKEHPALWIGVAISAVLLIVAYKAYKAQAAAANSGGTSAGGGSANSVGTVLPGTGQPDWLSSGNTQGVVGNAEIQAELANLLAYMQNPNTPNSPGVASSTPGSSGSSGSSSSGSSSSGSSSGPASWFDIIRGKVTSGQNAGYDARAAGVPLRSSPDGAVIGSLGYGSNVSISGPSVQGPNNLPAGATGGSTAWFPVAGGGFVSAADLASPTPTPVNP